MTEPSAPEADRKQLAQAIGSLIWKDPERILDMVSLLRGPDVVIECRLRGGSMGKAIPAGSALRVSLGRTPPYRVGEVIAFVQDSGICVHRVAYLGRNAQTSDFMITQGDACYYPDPPIPARQVLGPITAYRDEDRWISTGPEPSRDRASSRIGKALLRLVAGLMEVDVRLAQGAASALRIIRKERATAASA